MYGSATRYGRPNKNPTARVGFLDLLGLLMWRRLLALLAELFEFEARLQGLLVLRGVIVHLAAICALELDQIILGHNTFGGADGRD